jgi:hypothetical protein
MKPSDTHIERMAETFAERTPYLRKTVEEATQAWQDAIEISREDGTLEQMEANMRNKGTIDAVAEDVWERARDY